MPSRTPYSFPFGQTVTLVEQKDRSPKKVFILGVYASAVHARWFGPDGKQAVSALAVASEPTIFWRGDNVEGIISRIELPSGVGRLEAAQAKFNGPSGIALDEHFIHPLGLKREDVWLSDLVPHSCLNPSQKKAIERAYVPLMDDYKLPAVTLPPVPKQLADDERQRAILGEIIESKADVLILLGDQPIRWFLREYDDRRRTLRKFGMSAETYGRLHPTRLNGRSIQVLPLVHPRQAAKLGSHSSEWYDLHRHWAGNVAGNLNW